MYLLRNNDPFLRDNDLYLSGRVAGQSEKATDRISATVSEPLHALSVSVVNSIARKRCTGLFVNMTFFFICFSVLSRILIDPFYEYNPVTPLFVPAALKQNNLI